MNSLLSVIEPVNKLILDERNIMIVKLHDNKFFYKWLDDNTIMPTIKKYHTMSNTKSYEFEERTSGKLTPLFVTLAVIPKLKTKIKIACCDINVNRLANNIFLDIDSSGIIFNGSYFYLEQHVLNGMYGIDTSVDIYGRRGLLVEHNIKSYLHKPIGYFRYDSIENGNSKSSVSNPTYGKTYDEYSLKNKKFRDDNNVYDKNSPIMTLFSIKDTLGFANFSDNGGLYIESYSKYHDDRKKNENVVMGNLLVYNNEIVMNESKICVAILLFSIIELNLNIYDKIYLCDENYNKLTGDLLNDMVVDTVVHFISYEYPDDPSKRGKIKFNPDNIFLPYFVNFIRNAYPTGFAGRIPPGYPTHASDLNPRTCIIKDEMGTITVVHVEGRNEVCGGIGIDLFDLAKLCKGLGAKYALNLDGGGSSKLLWKEKFNKSDFVGLPSYNISNAIFIN